MKKLNKILMPVVGLSTIAATAIPLAACNKNGYTDGVEVTKTEWKDAFTYLAACKEGSTWKTSSEDVIQTIRTDSTGKVQQFDELFNLAFNDDYATFDGVGSGFGESWADSVNVTSIRKNNCYFTYNEETTIQGKSLLQYSIEPISIVQAALVEICSYYADMTDFTFDKDTKTYNYADYVYDETAGTLKYATSKVRFDSNKKISYINTHYGNLTPSDENLLVDVVLHPIYDNVKVELDQEHIDRANAHVKNMTDTTLTVNKSDILVKGINSRAPILLNITPKSNGLKVLTPVADGGTNVWFDVDGIYKNGKLLTEDNGYTVDNNVITFTEPLKTTDVINVPFNIGNINSTSVTKFTFTLA